MKREREKKKNYVCPYKILSLQRVKEPQWRGPRSPRSQPNPVLEGESSEDNTRPTSLLTVHFVYKIVMTEARSGGQCCVRKGFSKRTMGGFGFVLFYSFEGGDPQKHQDFEPDYPKNREAISSEEGT